MTIDTARPSVFLLIGQLGLGGAEYQVTLLAKGLLAQGVKVSVGVLFERGPHARTLSELGIPVTHLGFQRGAKPVRNAAAFAGLVRHLRRERPAIMHAHLPPAHLLGVPAARLAGVPVVVATLHTLDRYLRGRRWLAPVDRRAHKLCHHLFAVSAAVERFAVGRMGVPAHLVQVVHNGVPGEAFAAVFPADVQADGPVLVSVGNLNAHKGHCHLLDAAALLRNAGRPCTVVLVGDGPERERLREQAAALRVDVRFAGHQPDVRAWLARADVVVMPSLSESLGIAAVEAMAAMRPVVASEVGGLPELLRYRGVLVPPANATALADGIAWVLAHPAQARQLALEARIWSGTHLRADAMVDTYLAAYRRLAGWENTHAVAH
ncbi:glycosyltransferase [Nonomuraea sp. NPDC050536]|uniref:glycosyltransferase n=1 Tax=Nonomuraea sp. NPDC050536 TaxID=3364366 RepID=UPI0037C74F90